jgi:hypothetical protein
MEDIIISLTSLLHISAKHGPSSEKKCNKQRIIDYVPQSKLLTHQFKERHTVCGHVTSKDVYTDQRSCRGTCDNATKACRGNSDIDQPILKRQKTGLL